MKRFFSIAELASLASVSRPTIYNWIDVSSRAEELRASLGTLNDAGKISLDLAQHLLAENKREPLAVLLGELDAALVAASSVAPIALPEGLRCDTESPKSGRPPKWDAAILVSTARLAEDLGEQEPVIVCALIDEDVGIIYVRGRRFVATDALPQGFLDSLAARLGAIRVDLDALRSTLKDDSGEIWILGSHLARLLGWNKELVQARGWRTPWKGRRNNEAREYEYELSSLPEDLQIRVLKALDRRARIEGAA